MTVTSSDFINGPLADLGVSVTYTPVTTTQHNITGQDEFSDGSTSTITVVFENANQKYSLDKAGLTQGADARMFCKDTQTIRRNDKITYNSHTYRVENVSKRYFKDQAMFQTVLLYLITP